MINVSKDSKALKLHRLLKGKYEIKLKTEVTKELLPLLYTRSSWSVFSYKDLPEEFIT